TLCRDSERGNVSREVRVVEWVNPHHEVELLYRNITLIRRLMNDGPSSVRVPRLNLIRALNLPGREHDGIPCRSRCVRQRHCRVSRRGLGKGRLFALRTTEQIRHADDDVDDSSRADCHANHGTERPVIDSRRPFSSLPRFAFSKFDQAESSFRHERIPLLSASPQGFCAAPRNVIFPPAAPPSLRYSSPYIGSPPFFHRIELSRRRRDRGLMTETKKRNVGIADPRNLAGAEGKRERSSREPFSYPKASVIDPHIKYTRCHKCLNT
ncbi:hypothetical protein ALC56_03160, partial [Trachymyrmex septentrionalis]